MAHGLVDWSVHHLGLHRRHHPEQKPPQSEENHSMSGTKIDTIEEHVLAAGEKLKDLIEIHLPAIEEFISTLGRNPLVTAFSSVIPGELGEDAMAMLNGMAPILAALGAKSVQNQTPTETPAPSPAPDPGTSTAGDGGTTPGFEHA